jgi:1,2-phenylacetyl-CoA epoxidase catalytic subunit
MEEKGWQQRATSAMTCLDRRFDTWTDFVAANLVIDTALTTLLDAAVDSPYEPLRQRARKIQQEETGHWVHATGWMRRLPTADLQPALSAVWDHAFTWFGAPDDVVIGALANANLLADGPDVLRARLRTRLEPVLDEVGLAKPLLARDLAWDRWDARARRLAT